MNKLITFFLLLLCGHLHAQGVVSGNSLRINGNGTIGGTLAVTGNVTGNKFNGLTITSTTNGVLTVANSKTGTISNTLTFSGTDGSTLAIGTGGTLGTAAYTAASAYQTASANLTGLAGITYGQNMFPARTASGNGAPDTPITIGSEFTLAGNTLALANTYLQSGATSPAFTTSITTGSTTFALINGTATTVNFAGTATTLNIGASASGAAINLGGAANAAELRFLEPSAGGTSYTGFKAPALAANVMYTLPNAAGTTGQALVAGATPTTLEWGTVGGSGSVATDNIFDAAGDLVQGTGSNTSARLALGTAGQILQVNSGATAAEWTSNITPSSVTTSALVSPSIEFEGATADASETTLTVVDPTADRTATLPDADTKLPISSQHLTWTGPTAARTITIPDAAFTVARTDAANTFTGTQTFASATSLLLGSAGSAVGSVGFRNATSGTITLQPATGALGTVTATLPAANTVIPVIPQTITVSGPTAARTWTVTDADMTIVGTATTQTLTNKTLTSPVLGTKVQLPTAAGSSTLSTGGDAAYNTTNKLLGIHNGTKEVAVSTIRYMSWTFDPKAVCDGAVDRLFLMSTDIQSPFGIHVIKWKASFEADPTTEVDLDLKRADAFIGVANAAVMDVLDTTAGVSSEATSSNINSDAVVATSKVLYLEFGTAYTEANHQVIFEMWWEVEED